MTYVGFTGTRCGMRPTQQNALVRLLRELDPRAFIHGDCVGADAEGHVIAQGMGLKICIHPPIETALRAYCTYAAWVGRPTSYYARNRAIVESCDVLIAAPATMLERGGTWSTVKIARRTKKPIYILDPDGSGSWFKENV